MKYIYKLIFLLAFTFEMEGQIEEVHLAKNVSKSSFRQSLKITPRLRLFPTFDLVLSPQFGGLFDKSYQQVYGLAHFKKLYNNFDFGCILGLNYHLITKLIVTTVYNVGIIKFNKKNELTYNDAIMKVSLSYTF